MFHQLSKVGAADRAAANLGSGGGGGGGGGAGAHQQLLDLNTVDVTRLGKAVQG